MRLASPIYGLLVIYSLSVSVASASIPGFYHRVALTYDISPSILYAMALQESRPPKNLLPGIDKPWPWTLNCGGQGYYYWSRNDAYQHAEAFIESGINCDIGIMQISWRWHQQRFSSLGDAFDPYTNIKVGAEILLEQYELTGTWEAAVGAYHSPGDPERASKYREAVRLHLSQLLGHTQ